MARFGGTQLARRLALLLAGLALVGWLGWLFRDLYASRSELDRLRQEELLGEGSRRAVPLAHFLGERIIDLEVHAEDRALHAYYENRALGMSMAYGLGASLHGLRESLAGLQARRVLDGRPIYRRLLVVDASGQVLGEVRSQGATFAPPAEDRAGWAPLLSATDQAGRLRPLGPHLVVAVPYQFRPGEGGHLLAWIALADLHRFIVGDVAPAERLSLLLWEGRALPWHDDPSRIPAAAVVLRGASLAPDRSVRLEPGRPGEPGWLARRTEVPGSRLSLLTLIPAAVVDQGSPRAALLGSGALGLVLLLAVSWSILAQRRAHRELAAILETLPFAVAVVSRQRRLALANAEARRLLGLPARLLEGDDWNRFVPADAVEPGAPPRELAITPLTGPRRAVMVAEVPVELAGGTWLVVAFLDLTERKRLEAQLQQAQKLEAVGQLAAGIAHEINTPIQFVGDSVRFLQDGFGAMRGLLDAYRDAALQEAHRAGRAEVVRALADKEEEADLAYLEENVPAAFARTLEGISRVASIVGAMKEFAHPDQRQKLPADLNRALLNTLTIARNEYRYVADVQTELGAVPLVHCHLGALNQVFVNLLVNGAHAIREKVGDSGARGTITVRSALEGDQVRIDFQDSGSGIPEAIRHRIFEPFFTTKEVGRGTGQGLAIARAIVVERHGGTIGFTSEAGVGTTFTIRLPVGPPATAAAAGGRAAAEAPSPALGATGAHA